MAWWAGIFWWPPALVLPALRGQLLPVLSWPLPELVVFFSAVFCGYWAGVEAYFFAAAPRDDLTHIRGRKLSTSATEAARVMGAAKNAIRIHPSIPVTARALTSLLVVGAPGSGKSVLFFYLAQQLDCRTVYHDVKGDLTAGLPRPETQIALFAIGDARSVRWAIGRDIRDLASARRFAVLLIIESSDPMWSSGARIILVAVILEAQARHGTRWGARELAALLAGSAEEIKKMVLRRQPEGARLVEEMESRTTQSLLTSLAAYLAPVFDLARAEDDAQKNFSILDWAHGRGHSEIRALVLANGAKNRAVSAPAIAALIETLAAEAASPSYPEATARPIVFLLDELPQIGKKLTAILDLVAVGRSKKIYCWLGIQSFDQLREMWGHDAAAALISQTSLKIFFRAGGDSTARQMSEEVGEREVERALPGSGAQNQNAFSAPASQRERVAVMLPAEFQSLRPGQGVLISAPLKNAYRLRWPLTEWPERRPAYVPADWLSQKNEEPPAADVPLASPATPPQNAGDARELASAPEIAPEGHDEIEEPSQAQAPAAAPPPALPESPGKIDEPEKTASDEALSAAMLHALDLALPGAGTALEIASAAADVGGGNSSTAAAQTTNSAPAPAHRKRRRIVRRKKQNESER